MTFPDEFRNNALLAGLRMTIGDPFRGEKCPVKVRWCDHEAKTQAWKQDLGKRPEIDHASIAVEALQSIKWTSPVTKFAIVIIFNNNHSIVFGPLKERATSA